VDVSRPGDGPSFAICQSLPGAMTRYTNIGRKRTYLQASFDPENDQITTTNAASPPPLSTPDSSPFQHEASVDAALVKSGSRKRRRKSKGDSEEKRVAESTLVIAPHDGEQKAVVKSQKTKKALAKLKAKEKARRIKCTWFFFFL
jgi:hypothetical protein